MDNFRDSYFKVNWDLTTNSREGTCWGKQYDTGRGFVVTVINGDQVVTATNEVLRLKWEKPDNTTGYVNATIVNGKFIIENIDQMFTVQGSVRADFELSVGGKFVASTTFYVSVEKSVAVDSIESSSDFTALHSALLDVGTVQDSLDGYVDAESVRAANESIRIDNESIRIDNESNREAAEALRQTGYATMDEAIALKADLSEIEAARGTEPTLGARLDSTDAQLNNMTQDFTQHKLDYAEQVGNTNNLATESKVLVGAVNELTNGKANKTQNAWITPTLMNGHTGTLTYRINSIGNLEIQGRLTAPETVGSTYSNTQYRQVCKFVLPKKLNSTSYISVKTGGYYDIGTSSFLIGTSGTLSLYHGGNADSWYFEHTVSLP